MYQILQKFNIVGPKEKKVIEQSLLINSQYEEFNCKSLSKFELNEHFT